MLKHDPIEDDENYSKIIQLVDEEVEILLKNTSKTIGYIHVHDNLKKRILKEKYNINWKTTSEMNPDIIID